MGISRQALKFCVKRLLERLKPIWTECNEIALGIRTVASPDVAAVANYGNSSWKGATTSKAKHRDNYGYATPDYWYLRKIISILDPRPDDVVYDIGSGLGRFTCMVARRRVCRCVGIELFEPLCQKAERNASSLRGRRSKIDVICADATTADVSDGTIYFMFNPFGPDTMNDTLANIKRSLGPNPRNIRIVYCNSVHESVLRSCGWLEEFHRFCTYSGNTVGFWRNINRQGP